MKTILIILVVAFMATIVFSWGMGGLKCGSGMKIQEGVIASVNGSEVSREQFEMAYQNELDAYKQRTGQELDENQAQAIQDQVWQYIIDNQLITSEIDKIGLGATAEEIRYYIFDEPVSFIKEQEAFKNESGVFDFNRYQAALNDARYGNYWFMIEQALVTNLPTQKFEHAMRASVRVTDDEVRRDYLTKNAKAKINYIYFDPRNLSQEDAEISDVELRAYYQEHEDQFQETEKRNLYYVMFSTRATADDTLAIETLANELLERARQGEDFAELAEIYSDDPGSAENGGDLGFFDKNAMVKPFSDAAFGAKIGDLVGPVVTNYGLHIIKVEDKKTEDGEPKVQARHILIKYAAQQSTIENANYDARYFSDRIRDGEDFYELATTDSLEVQSTGFFADGGFIPQIGREPRTARFIFVADVGTVSNPMKINDGYIVFRIAEVQPERTQPFEDAKNRITSIVKREHSKELSKQFCEAASEKVTAGTPLYKVAEDDSLEVTESDWLTPTDYLPGAGRAPAVVSTALAMEPGEIAGPLEGQNGYFIIQLLEKTTFDEQDFESKKSSLRSQLLATKKNGIYQDWLADIKKKAKIQDYRGYYGF